MARKPPKHGVNLLPNSFEAAMYFVNPDGINAAFALREYRERTGADVKQFRAGLSLLWHRDPLREVVA